MLSWFWSLAIGLLAAIIAVGLDAAYSALTELSGGAVRKLELRNKELARRGENWLERRDELLALVRLVLMVDVLLLAYCGASWVLTSAQNRGMGYVAICWPPLLMICVFFLITGLLARHLNGLTGMRFLALAIPAIRSVALLLFPLSAPLVFIQRHAERRGRQRSEEEERATAEDEIMSLVEQGENNGAAEDGLQDDERRMIRGVFDLDETLVHEIMTPRVDVDAIENTASVPEIKTRILETGHSRIPVFHGTIDHIVGVIFAKDLLDDRKLTDFTALSDLYRRPIFIPESKNVGELLAEFQQTRNHFAVVLDEYGGTAGVVTFEDILEEIVGDIRDEYDINEPQLITQKQADGSVLLDARIGIDELEEVLDVDLPDEEDYDTLGGYISYNAGHIPEIGDEITTDLLSAEICSADSRRILQVRVKKLDASNESTE